MAEALGRVAVTAANRKRLSHFTTEIVTLEMLGTIVAVHFDDVDAAARYRRRYERFQSADTPTVHAYAVRDADETLFWYGDRLGFRWDAPLTDPAAIDFLADSVVRREFFGERSDALTFHAAAVETARGAVAIVGPSTGGKTTTALACARRGMRLFTDEECVYASGRVHPFPRALNLRADGIARILADPIFADGGIRARLAERAGSDWVCASFDELFATRELPDGAPLVAIYFLAPGGPPATIAPLPLDEALRAFFAAWPRSARHGVERVAETLRLFAAAPPFSLRLGTPDETALAIDAVARA